MCRLRIMLVLCLALFSCRPDKAVTPPHLIGIWETHSQGYTDHYLFLDQGRIGFSSGTANANGYLITKVHESQEEARILYVIMYQDAGKGQYQLAFYYDSRDGGRITFKNQDHLTWKRKDAAT